MTYKIVFMLAASLGASILIMNLKKSRTFYDIAVTFFFTVAMIVLAGVVLNNCARNKGADDPPPALDQKVEFYKSEFNRRWPDGHPHGDDCDGSYFAGWHGAAGLPVDMRAYVKEPGFLMRRTTDRLDCYTDIQPDGRRASASQCSGDGYLAYMTWLWFSELLPREERLTLAKDIWDRGDGRGWIMCEGDVSRTKLSNSMVGTLAWLIYRLGGQKHYQADDPKYTVAITGLETGYERYLAASHAFLRGELTGRVPGGILAVLEGQMNDQEHNPFYAAVFHRFSDGDQGRSAGQLLDGKYWPNDRLPTVTENYSDEWVIRRDWGHNWEPDTDPGLVMTGAELLWVYRIITY